VVDYQDKNDLYDFMKNVSSATLGIIATGQALLAELYDITLANGGPTYSFTSFQVSLSAAVYPSVTPATYLTGLTIKRDTITQKVGVEAGQMKLTLTPQGDSPNAPVEIAGYPILQAARYGFLDGATVRLSKLFMNEPAAGSPLDTSPGAVAWYVGTIQQLEMDRFSVVATVDDYLAYLGNQQMPRVLYQVGCFHNVYDAGCTLLKSAFTVSGTLTSVGDAAHFVASALGQPTAYFNLGVLTFTSGVNNGKQANVASFAAGGAFAMRNPFAQAPSPGDTFTVYPGCDLQQATCSNSNSAVGPPFNNLSHFSGQPYVPVPETITDGGTDNPPAQTPGAQAGQVIGSAVTMQTSIPGGYIT
jgi:hypothetical protein